jgi:hypothetical protein
MKLPMDLKSFKPTLKLESKTFKPTTIPKIEHSPAKKIEDKKELDLKLQESKMDSPLISKLNLNAPIFKPLNPVALPE